MTGRPAHLVQILLPKETGGGEPVSRQWFDALLKELTTGSTASPMAGSLGACSRAPSYQRLVP